MDLDLVVLGPTVEEVDELMVGGGDGHQELPCGSFKNVLLRDLLLVLLKHLSFTSDVPK